jgi:ketosteroid isomerase-like protein
MKYVWLALLLCTCAKKVPAPEPVVETKAPDPRAEVNALLKSAYKAMTEGDGEALANCFTEDASVFGLGPGDTFDSRADLMPHVREAFLAITLGGSSMAVLDSRPLVALLEAGESAFLSDFPRLTATRRQKDSTWFPRITAHVVKTASGYQFDAMHVSLSLADSVLTSPDVNKRVLPPKDVLSERGEGSDELVGLTKRILSDYEIKMQRTSERSEFIQIGTSGSEVFEDGLAFKALLKPQISAIKKAGYTFKLDGALRSRVKGSSGWVMGSVQQRVGSGKKTVTYPLFRVLWIFVKDNGVWNIASEHQSLSTREEFRQAADGEATQVWRAQQSASEKMRTSANKLVETPDGGREKPDAGFGTKKSTRLGVDAGTKNTGSSVPIGAW